MCRCLNCLQSLLATVPSVILFYVLSKFQNEISDIQHRRLSNKLHSNFMHFSQATSTLSRMSLKSSWKQTKCFLSTSSFSNFFAFHTEKTEITSVVTLAFSFIHFGERCQKGFVFGNRKRRFNVDERKIRKRIGVFKFIRLRVDVALLSLLFANHEYRVTMLSLTWLVSTLCSLHWHVYCIIFKRICCKKPQILQTPSKCFGFNIAHMNAFQLALTIH